MKKLVTVDCETYPNYFLVAFKGVDSGRVITLELKGENEFFEGEPLTLLKGIMAKNRTFGFNSLNFDLPIITGAAMGFPARRLCTMANFIIQEGAKHWTTARQFGLASPRWEHFDLIEVAPGQASLKLYGGRLQCPTLWDLPISPGSTLTPEQMAEIKEYCGNDLETTIALYHRIKKEIDLREKLSEQYGVDLLSKSDAQIAEAVIVSELKTHKVSAPRYTSATTFQYKPPAFLEFRTPALQAAFTLIARTAFRLDGRGSIALPKEISDSRITLGKSTYQIGIGGLHSTEHCRYIIPPEGFTLIDKDVTSYYPSIILNQKLYPIQLSEKFLDVYGSIVERRIRAKKSGDKVTADSLKIVINGSFGKFGNLYSALYSPQLLIQVTLTGQLALLMLIERLELAGFSVVSANTDGFVTLVQTTASRSFEFEKVCTQWEIETGFRLEATKYDALFSRDVNNYLGVKKDGSEKAIGIFRTDEDDALRKNPSFPICVDAAKAFLIYGTPVSETIRNCKDVRQFLSVRKVTGGAVFVPSNEEARFLIGGKPSSARTLATAQKHAERDGEALTIEYGAARWSRQRSNGGKWGNSYVSGGEYLGKVARWYYSKNGGTIRYKTNGNTVPKSESSRPMMTLTATLPNDLDFERYIQESIEILNEVGIFSDF